MFGIGHAGKRAVAVVDVGSGSVGMGVALVGDDGPAELILAERSVLSLEHRTPDHIASDIVGLIASVGEKVHAAYVSEYQKKHGRIRSVYAVIRAPWTRSVSSSSKELFKEDVTITEQMISEYASQALGKAEDLDKEAILDANVIRVELNGYPTAKPGGKRAHVVRVVVLASDCDARIRQATIEHLQRLFAVREPELHSGARAMLTVMRDRCEMSQSAVILDMTSEATNVIILRKGVTDEHALIPIGVRSILSRVAGNKLPEEIMGTVRMVTRDQCHTQACEEALSALSHIETELVKEFGEVFNSMASTRRLPNQCILIVHPDMAHWLAHVFERIDFSQFTVTAQPFEISLLSVGDLKKSAVATSPAQEDIGLLITSALVNSTLQE